MAVVTVKSGPITNRDATPRVLNNSAVQGADMRQSAGTVEVTSGDSIASKYIMCQVPSNARMSQILVYSDDMGTTTIADFGLYQTTENGSAVVDADFFASAVSLKDGALNASDITHEATGTYDIDDAEKPLWSALGLSADPCISYDLVATLTAACDGTGTLTVKASYTI